MPGWPGLMSYGSSGLDTAPEVVGGCGSVEVEEASCLLRVPRGGELSWVKLWGAELSVQPLRARLVERLAPPSPFSLHKRE